MSFRRSLFAFVLTALFFPSTGATHGGVVEEDDICVINIGYLKAHFKIYVPEERGHEQYCEDIPVRGGSVFVMEYLHEGLSDAEIDFRIIENVTGKGIFARLTDVEAIDDLDAVTLRYEAPRVVPGVYMLLQPFDADGEYIGIVSARNKDDGKLHTAVFPFEVGYTGIGYWPLFIAAIVLLQLNYWLMSRRRRRAAAAALAVVAVLALSPAPSFADDPAPSRSRDGHFLVRYEPGIDPLVINRIHAWTLVVTTADGEPVDDAKLKVTGGMPVHDHGLPTAPRATAAGSGGRYRVDGLRFHMGGDWELIVEIDDGQRRDVVTIVFSL